MSAEIVQTFTEGQASRLTGVSRNQLRAWAADGFLVPSVFEQKRVGRYYSFRDLMNLRVIGTLRNDHGVSLQHLKSVAVKLREMDEAEWSTLTLYTLCKRVIYQPEGEAALEEVNSGQKILDVPLRVVRSKLEDRVREEFARKSGDFGKIEKMRNVKRSAPVIAGTRITVSAVQAFIDAGYSNEAILEEYPSLRPEDIDAVRSGGQAA